MYSAWTQHYVSEVIDNTTCMVDIADWRQIHDDNEGAKRIFAKIVANDTTMYMALGAPVTVNELPGTSPRLFLPHWVLDTFGFDGYLGNEIDVEWITDEYFPSATRIVLRPHDPVFYSVDAKEELERALTRMGVLKLNTTFPIRLEALDGYVVSVDVTVLEPAEIVLLDGDEVEIQFESSEGGAPPVAPVPLTSESVTESFDEMIPSDPVTTVIADGGYTLGGTTKPMVNGKPWNPWR